MVAFLLLGLPGFAVAGQPVIFAIDTSRSLTRKDMRTVATTVRGILEHLPAGTSFGLLAFDDSPRWVVEPPATADRVAIAAGELVPAGSFTLLNDALFTAARALPDGGVILLMTDGRDENSATTVEDVATLCRSQHVRIIAVGTGRRVDGKALRRFALLTGGAVLGRANQADAAGAADSVLMSLTEIASEVEAARPPATPKAEAPPPTAVPARPAVVQTEGTPRWLLPLLLLLLLAVLATFFVLWRWRTASRSESGAGPAREWETDPMMSSGVGGVAPKDPGLDLGPTPPMEEAADELLLDPAAFERLPFDGDLDRTSILDEEHILSLREAGKKSRSFRLREDRAFAVGRAPGVNTLVLGSKALSAQHFKIVPHEGGFAIVDLESTNGTLVNGRKIRARRLEPGDVIRAGDVELEYRVVLKPLS